MTPTESRRLARSQRDRAAYDARKARKQRAAEEAVMRAAEQKRREEEAKRLQAEARRLADEERRQHDAEARAKRLAEAEERRKNPPRYEQPGEPTGRFMGENERPLRRGIGGGWLAMALVLAAVGHEEPTPTPHPRAGKPA